jgi:cell division protein FtsN
MQNQFGRQNGGTLLGLVIGLIIGLGIAVAVAVTVKNTPLPFVTKTAPADKRSETAPTQSVDPNKSLYGSKPTGKEAAQEFSRKMEERNAVSARSDPAPAERAQEAKPVPGKSSAGSAEGEASGEAAEAKFNYYLQAGAFLQQADAENTKGKLALLGVTANISERHAETGTLYRVRIGPFAQQETMNRMRSRLSDNGVDVAVVRVPR